MSRWLIFLIIGASLSAGCASQPRENPWAGATTETGAAAGSLDCGSFPFPSEARDTNDDGQPDLFIYDSSGANDLEQYRICSEANEGNVDEHAAQIMQLKVARASLVQSGKSQRHLTEMAQQMLEEERRHNFWQKLGWAAIAIAGVAL